MTNSEFLKIISSIKPDKHIIAGRRGSEENVKIKIILPLLQFLGYDVVEDLDFENLGADIVMLDKNSKPVLIVETKAWEQQITNHLDQCLEYTLKLRTPFVMITSGQHTALYSSLINLDGLKDTKPIIEFSFADLLGEDRESILNKLYALIGKENLLNGAEELNKAVAGLLSDDKDLSGAKREFAGKCEKFESSIKTSKITEDDFIELANNHPKEVYNALILAKDEFYKIAEENKNISIRYRSKEIGLEYLSFGAPRRKILGLAGIYPERAMIAFGLENWRKLLLSSKIIKKIESVDRHVKDEKQVMDVINLLRMAIKEIQEVAGD